MKLVFRLLSLIAIVMVLPHQSFACNAVKDSKTLILNYPVVVSGQFSDSNTFKISNVYKGLRSSSLEINLSGIDKSQIKIGQPAIILSQFERDHAVLKDCGIIVYNDSNSNGISYPSLLAEAAVYDAIVKNKIDFPLDKEDWRKYEEISSFLRENKDYLALLELSHKTLEYVIPKVHTNYYNNGWDVNQCAGSIHPDSPYLTSDLMNALAASIKSGSLMASYILRDTINDLGRSLLAIKDYDAALYDLCATDTDGLFLEAALAAKRPDILGNKNLDRIYNISDIDLSGVSLRQIQAGGKWQRVKVDGTDFTNASFIEAKFDDVNLSNAKLDLVTYSCKTEFPQGFDPIIHHMIPAWKFHGCDNVPQPKINLAKMHLVDSSVGAHSDYGTGAIVLRYINFENVDAQSSVLGTIRCDCKVNNADFSGTEVALKFIEHKATISNSSFRDAKLNGSDFHQATFINVDFTGADLSNVIFNDATYDSSTKWPKDFSPEGAGMVKSTQ